MDLENQICPYLIYDFNYVVLNFFVCDMYLLLPELFRLESAFLNVKPIIIKRIKNGQYPTLYLESVPKLGVEKAKKVDNVKT